MFDFLRLFPRRPLLTSAAAWAFFFAIQVGYLTYAMSERYVPPLETRPYDRLWFVYTQLPRMLPMAAIYAGCMVLVSQIFGRFMATDNPDNLTIGQWRKLLRDSPARAIKRMSLMLVAFLATVGILVDPIRHTIPGWVVSYLFFAAALSWTSLLIPQWFDWIVGRVTPPSPDDRGGTRQMDTDADDTD